jgi:hypothetical protein
MKQIHCHKLVRATAIEMAGELYDDVMRGDNTLYSQWKSVCPELTPALCEMKFIELLWPKMVEQARATLAQMLGTNIPEDQKQIIYDALICDGMLGRDKRALH